MLSAEIDINDGVVRRMLGRIGGLLRRQGKAVEEDLKKAGRTDSRRAPRTEAEEALAEAMGWETAAWRETKEKVADAVGTAINDL